MGGFVVGAGVGALLLFEIIVGVGSWVFTTIGGGGVLVVAGGASLRGRENPPIKIIEAMSSFPMILSMDLQSQII
ncbi:MAG: hypothetical protein AAB909_00015 [Patescibacteria group bacterium]